MPQTVLPETFSGCYCESKQNVVSSLWFLGTNYNRNTTTNFVSFLPYSMEPMEVDVD